MRGRQWKTEISWFFGVARGHERLGKSYAGFAQIDGLRDVEVERGASRNSDEIRVLVQLLQKTFGVDLPTGLEPRGEGVFNPTGGNCYIRCPLSPPDLSLTSINPAGNTGEPAKLPGSLASKSSDASSRHSRSPRAWASRASSDSGSTCCELEIENCGSSAILRFRPVFVTLRLWKRFRL